jgi:prevent-host-death family protein
MDMADISATEAKNRFGELLELAQAEPVVIRKNGRESAVLVSAAEFRRLQAAANRSAVNPLVRELHAESLKRYGKVYERLAK